MQITSKTLLILLITLGFVVLLSEPNKRGFYCDDFSIREPFIELQISLRQLLMFSVLIPNIVIILSQLLSNKWTQNTIKAQIAHKLIGFNFGLLANVVVLLVVKNIFGRLRPHAIQFCNASHYCSEEIEDKFVSHFECRNEEHPYLVKNVRHSFYSGHASIAVYSGVYLILYLKSKIWPKINLFKYLVIIIYLMIAMISLYPGFTQWNNKWHFGSDVLTGYAIGFSSAILIFKLINCDINCETNNSGNNYIPLQKLLTTSAVFH